MDALKIGITCYPTVGGSGVIASALGEELAARGHQIHFISYERPFRLPASAPNIHFHPVSISDYGLFKYPDYTLPLSVKMAEVTRDHQLDILHVHYAVPHATAALLAKGMLPPPQQPRIITTLHGTDTTLLGADPAYGPAIRHALDCSDAVTTVSTFLKTETQRLLNFTKPIDVIHNFFALRPPRRTREQMRRELGLTSETMLLHCSNLRPVKRIDLLLQSAAQVRGNFKLVILAAGNFEPFQPLLEQLNLQNKVIIRHRANEVEDYLQAADLALYTSESESFCLGILEAMWFAVPGIAPRVGGIPEVIDHNRTGLITPFADPAATAQAIDSLIANPAHRATLGTAAQQAAHSRFSAQSIIPQYESLYRRILQNPQR